MRIYTFPITICAEGSCIDEAWENAIDLYGMHGIAVPTRPPDIMVESFDPDECEEGEDHGPVDSESPSE